MKTFLALALILTSFHTMAENSRCSSSFNSMQTSYKTAVSYRKDAEDDISKIKRHINLFISDKIDFNPEIFCRHYSNAIRNLRASDKRAKSAMDKADIAYDYCEVDSNIDYAIDLGEYAENLIAVNYKTKNEYLKRIKQKVYSCDS